MALPDLEAAARGCLRRLTGAEEALRSLYLQPDRAVYLAEQAQIVLKVYTAGATLAREWAVARRARAAGIPAAEPMGFAPGHPAVLAMRQVIGRPLSSKLPEAARDAGVQVARFHRLGAHPPFADGQRRWEDFILSWAERELASLRRLGVLDDGEIGDLWRRFDQLRNDLIGRPVVLPHGDLQPDHLLVAPEGTSILALIDFADAQPGDPLMDIAVLTLWDRGLAAPVLAGYGIIDNDPLTQRLLTHYRLLRLLGEVSWLLERGFNELAERSTVTIKAVLRERGR